ncbi:hypothetical protein [uncultured Dokdonia sp.]|uniref:hypothetical protein n=1 Tax=uncultured Dokdonia sp. TaxID=575653 RepID=UPI00261D1B54|nr:hypothetical protein [uncultured Dokdonia sp.]
MKFLSWIFNKRNPLSKEKWSETLTKVVKAENQEDLRLPVILFDNDIAWEFEVFNTLEGLVDRSIYSHWGGLTPNDSQLNAIIVDSNGVIYKIDNDRYNEDLKIGYSFPIRQEKEFSLEEIKAKIIIGKNEYLEVFDPDSKIEILNGIELVNKSTTIIEVIDSVNSNLDFYKLK